MKYGSFSIKFTLTKRGLAILVVLWAFQIFVPIPAQAEISSWQKGASVTPEHSTDLSSSTFRQSLDNLKAANANTISFVIPLSQASVYSTDIAPAANNPTDESLVSASAYAHSLGFQVAFKPHVDTRDGQWRANIDPPDRDGWFNAYENILLRYARLAEANHVEQIIVGTELVFLSSDTRNPTNTQHWQKIISDVRAVYSGTLMYAANWGTGVYDEKNQIVFWPHLDYAGIDAYYPLGSSGNSVESFLAAWDIWYHSDILPFAQKIGKPIIFTEIGYKSTPGSYLDPGNYTINNGMDEVTQANAFQAMFSYAHNVPFIKGVYIWEWKTNPDAGGGNNTDYTPQNKSAQSVITSWFGGQGTSTPYAPGSQALSAAALPVGNPAAVNQNLSISVTVQNTGSAQTNRIVDLEVYNSENQKVYQQVFENQTLPAQGVSQFQAVWFPVLSGHYTIKVGIFSSNWSQNYYWNNTAGSIVVGQASTAVDLASFSATAEAPSLVTTHTPVQVVADVINTGSAISGVQSDVEIYDANYQQVYQRVFVSQSFTAGERKQLPVEWTPVTAGMYHIRVGVFNSDWSRNYVWNNLAAVFSAQDFVVTVPDTQAPVLQLTTPLDKAVVFATTTLVSAVSDNTSISGVQFYLDSLPLGPEKKTFPYENAWDTTLFADGGHTLFSVARDGAGNQATSSAITVTVSNSAPSSPACPAEVPANVFSACYYQGRNFNTFKLAKIENSINYDWGFGAAVSGLDNDNYSALWQGNFLFLAASAGSEYEFNVLADDGVRLYVDGVLVVNQWQDQVASYTVRKIMTNGVHAVRLEYFEHSGGARVSLSWNAVASVVPQPDTAAPSVPANLSSDSVAQTAANLYWNVSTDNIGVFGYKLYKNNSLIATLSETFYTDSSLVPGTSYAYSVSSYDAAGNESSRSQVLVVVTQFAPLQVGSSPPVISVDPVINVWWPNTETTISGTLPFKAVAQNLLLQNYDMFWQVDGDTLNLMYNSSTDFPHKETWVDVSGWNWHPEGSYMLTFTVKDISGNSIASKNIPVRISR